MKNKTAVQNYCMSFRVYIPYISTIGRYTCNMFKTSFIYYNKELNDWLSGR